MDAPCSPGLRFQGKAVQGTLICCVLAGALSIFCAEVLSGASILWFLQPWGWLVTFPLYMVHLVFFFSLAVYFQRTSLGSLYCFGVLFGLYESWITKVTWAGYMDASGPAWGTVLGFAPAEFLVIVLFWHPVFSFILPLLLFGVFSQTASPDNAILPFQRLLSAKSRTATGILAGTALTGAAFLSMNSQFNIAAALITLLGSVLIIWVLYRAVVWSTGGRFSVISLVLGRRGFFIAGAYLFLLYILGFILLFPGRIPQPPTLILTLAIYAGVVVLLWLDRPEPAIPEPDEHPVVLAGMRSLVISLGLACLLIIGFCLIPPLGTMAGTILYLILMGIGLLLAGYFFGGIAGRVLLPAKRA